MLTIENLSYYKNYKKIFSSLGFSIANGSCLVITGKNGSGKTSLLRIIAGISAINSNTDVDNNSDLNQGKVLWNGRNIEDFRHDFNNDLQYLGHKNALKQDLTVKENLEFYAKLSGSEDLVASAIKFFHLEEFSKINVRKLSAGWQKKVALARLLACPSTIWILDEPTNNLDKESRSNLHGLLETKISDGGLVIIATHDEEFYDLGQILNIEDYGV